MIPTMAGSRTYGGPAYYDSHLPVTGLVNWLLGIKVTRDQEARTISLSQEGYISSILARFNLQDAKAVDTPMMPSATYSKEDCLANDTKCYALWGVRPIGKSSCTEDGMLTSQ